MARPGPISRRRTQARANGISNDVPDGFHRPFLASHDPGPVSALEEMTLRLVLPVEVLGISAVEAVHRLRECAGRRLGKQVVVVPHQAVGMADQAVCRASPLEESQKVMPILICDVDVCPARTPSAEMEDQAGALDPRTCSHGPRGYELESRTSATTCFSFVEASTNAGGPETLASGSGVSAGGPETLASGSGVSGARGREVER